VNRLKQHAPELITIMVLVFAVAAIELRRASIQLSPEPGAWTPGASDTDPRVIYDSSGEKLVISRRPSRIVSQTLGSDEILFGVCAGDRIVGVSPAALEDRYSNVAAQVRARNLPIIKNPEQATELKPDLVFVARYSSAEQIELLRSTGIAVFRLINFDQIHGIEGNIRAVGCAVGDENCATTLVADMRQRIQKAAMQAPTHHTSPRVMVYGTAGYTEGSNTLTDEMLHVVGARNVAADHGVKGSARISAEAITLWQPDFLGVGAPREDFSRVRGAMLADPAIADSPAGRAGQIILIEDATSCAYRSTSYPRSKRWLSDYTRKARQCSRLPDPSSDCWGE
jgi:iron complex transport system substrate-binding protein